jgi:hypothetical protein
MSEETDARLAAWRDALLVEIEKAIRILELDIYHPGDVFIDITAAFHRISEKVSSILIDGDPGEPIMVADDRQLYIRLGGRDIYVADVGDKEEYWKNGALYWRKL